MIIEPLFKIPRPAEPDAVVISFEGRDLTVPAGISVAAALLSGGVSDFRSSAVGDVPRAPYCMMGVCFECLVEIDDVPARQSCLIPVQNGMKIKRQAGAAELRSIDAGEKHD
jgi:D-hydroxyproline dehydrogenase subunit gamma